ncbi:MAG: hypothetical protein K2W97_04160 [Chthoniobacterales bacterium]|nr:hypothetical protein [Chthoniobacterales bacterium]
MKCPMGRDYDLYLPEKIDPDRTYWLVCYVHGAHGTAQDDIKSLQHFVDNIDCIGVAPSFARGFQLLENKTDEQLIGILHQLSSKYKLHEKLFVYGHSAGGQFTHRFMLRHPDLVIACEACSSGTWATGGVYQSLTSAAKAVPMTIACGSEDSGKIGGVIERLALNCSVTAHTPKENPGWNRVEWFKKFMQQLEKEKFFFRAKVFPGESHQVQESEQEKLAMESFLLGTCGMLPVERATYDAAIATIKKNSADKNFELVKSELQQLRHDVDSRSKETVCAALLVQDWHVNEAALDQCLRAAEEFVNEEINFLQK